MSKRCPEKVRMPTEADARKALRKLTEKGRGQTRYYHCPYCDGWHTTSRPPRPSPGRVAQRERRYGRAAAEGVESEDVDRGRDAPTPDPTATGGES